MEHSVLGAEEPTEAHLDLASDLPQETVSQEGEDTLSVLTVCSVATEREPHWLCLKWKLSTVLFVR